jgi:spermidine synthase
MRERAGAWQGFFAIAAISLAVILLEISYTRILSFKVYYYFTYLIIGLAMLGLGSGGIFFSLSARVRGLALERLVPVAGAAAGVLVAVGYPLIAALRLAVSAIGERPTEIAELAAVALLLFLPFLAAGIAITALLSSRSGAIGRMYAADLLGAGAGCAGAVPLLIALTPPGVVVASSALLLLAGLPLALRGGDRRLASGLVLGAIGIAAWPLLAGGLPDPSVDPNKQLTESRRDGMVIHSEWSPVFRIDVSRYDPNGDPFYWIQHDGQLGSTLQRFDGDAARLSRFDSDSRALPFAAVDPAPRVLIIGAAGGHEIVASLHFGAEHIDAVELNPATLRLLTELFPDYSGRLHENPRVTLVNAEGRSYLARQDRQWDLIWLVAPDSYAAMNAASAGAFVLSESYLYTVEMIREAIAHLTPGGILCAQFGELSYDDKPNRTARFLSTARRALSESGLGAFPRRVLLATSRDFFTLSTVLLSREPFSAEQVARFTAAAERVPGTVVRHAPALAPTDGPVDRVIRMPEDRLASWLDEHAYDLAPVTDDSPFFWHFVRLRDAFSIDVSTKYLVDWEDAIGERVLLVLLGVVIVLAATFLLLPLLTVRGVWRAIPWKAEASAYFAALGVGFMLVEVCLIQMLTLFLGYPTYSLSVTLFGLLVFSGIGSAVSGRFTARRDRALLVLLAALAILIGFLRVGLPGVVDALVGSPLAVRVAATLAMIAPLGLCLGAFLPLGLETVAALTPHAREYVAWAWAINGFFSVITSILATLLAMSLGFRTVLLLGFAIYALGVLAMRRVPAPGRSPAG